MVVKILFLGEFDLREIVPAPIKVGKELFNVFTKRGLNVVYLPYFQDGKIYSRFQKLFGFEKIAYKVFRTGIFPLIAFVIKFKPQIIHILKSDLYYFVLLPLRPFLKFKIIYSNHSIISLSLKKFWKVSCYQRLRLKLIERLAFSYSDRILTLSDLEARFIRLYLMVPQIKINIVNNGFNYYPVTNNYSGAYNLLKVITVGAFSRSEKGLLFLIKTLSQLNLRVEITICNYEYQDKPNLNYSEKLNIVIKAPLDERRLREEIAMNDLFIASSAYESFNISLLEAMSTGIVFLASSRVGLTERFNPKLKCLVFQKGNSNDLIDRIHFYLKMDKVQKLSLSSEIINFTKNYSWDIIADSYIKIYKEILIK